jgi:anti-sigma regulatory factor (Ser/Thr protein kinase)
MRQSSIILVTEITQVGEARRRAESLARDLGWNATDIGKLAIGVTEAATNLVKHAQAGEIHLQVCGARHGDGIEMLAIDRGPGMGRLAESLADGYSTVGTYGQGLGAIVRSATEFDIYSEPGKGTALVGRFYRDGAALPSLRVGSVQSPIAGEEVCGDNWGLRFEEDSAVILLADGLGHGAGAAAASQRAVKVLTDAEELAPLALLDYVHRALRGTRGAAVAIARIDFANGTLSFAGIGNISAVLAQGTTSRSLLSHTGTAGDNARKMQQFDYPWPAHGRLIMHSDGLTTRWNLNGYPNLTATDPALTAAVLYRDARRDRDDACILVAQGRD